MSHPAIEVQKYGQSIWLDYIHRKDLANGALQKRIDTEGILGVTSNPTIFQQAIGESDTYDEAISSLMELTPEEIYDRLSIEDIQQATDLFRPVYDRTNRRDGYVSLEVSPLLANNSADTASEARRLFAAVNRPNLMVKIPGTEAGLPAIEEAIAAGVNINVTLIFSVKNYEQVAEAYIRGLERRLEAGLPVDHVASVASFFLSRIDSAVDRILENNLRAAQVHGDTARISANRRLLGQAAITNAKLAYRAFKRIFQGQRFARLREAGAQVQRPLWASTGTKNPAYSDTRYIDLLIGRDTVNTVPPKTLAAFIDHGRAIEDSIEREFEDMLPPDEVFDKLAEVGVDMDLVTDRLQTDGVDAFVDSFQKLIEQVAAKRNVLQSGIIARQHLAMGLHTDAVNSALAELEREFVNGRIWSKDGSVWKSFGPTIAKIEQRLGWLDVLTTIDRERLQALQDSVRGSHWSSVVLLGMGGSSLAPEVLFRAFGQQPGFPRLLVLDSTDPAQVRAVEDAVDLPNTLFIVASKSGTTIETDAFYRYFYARTNHNGAQFIAITDANTVLEKLARDQNFRDVFINPSDIGGRYSALSYFGMVPAALIGLDLKRAWQNVQQMVAACADNVPAVVHPGLTLGAVIGALGKQGRDKITIHGTKTLDSFGAWAEQLIAESLGKEGKGVVPIVGATVGKPHDYSSDRLFIYLRMDDDSDVVDMDTGIRTLREAGHPRVTLRLPDAYSLFGEFFRWEFATAVAGQMFKVNPFDEPNVTEAKEATKQILDYVQQHGHLPRHKPTIEGGRVEVYIDETHSAALRDMSRSHGYEEESRTEFLAAQIVGTHAGDYFAILAYLTPTPQVEDQIRVVARRLRHVTKRGVTLGYGPRYLHSTGQLHKGGPNTGVFFQITREIDPAQDLAIPGLPFTFGTLFSAQAAGDLATLQKHGCRAIRIHVKGELQDGLDKLMAAIDFVAQRRQ